MYVLSSTENLLQTKSDIFTAFTLFRKAFVDLLFFRFVTQCVFISYINKKALYVYESGGRKLFQYLLSTCFFAFFGMKKIYINYLFEFIFKEAFSVYFIVDLTNIIYLKFRPLWYYRNS